MITQPSTQAMKIMTRITAHQSPLAKLSAPNTSRRHVVLSARANTPRVVKKHGYNVEYEDYDENNTPRIEKTDC